MRELTGNIGINEETFEPVILLMLDGVETGTSLTIEALTDVKTFHGPAAEQAIIETAIDDLNDRQDLTPEEIQHYTTNFKSLVLL